jgi:ABC-type dipeptide/oligopeptide/nickel transport system permease subunit
LASALSRKRAGAIGLAILVLNIVVALAAPIVAPHDPLDQDVARRLLPPVWLAGGGAEHLLGTDQLGRDILSRIIYGSRISLLIGLLSVGLSLPIGVGLGLLAGYFGRHLDDVTMRIADVQLAFPFILLAITIAGVLGPSPRKRSSSRRRGASAAGTRASSRATCCRTSSRRSSWSGHSPWPR